MAKLYYTDLSKKTIKEDFNYDDPLWFYDFKQLINGMDDGKTFYVLITTFKNSLMNQIYLTKSNYKLIEILEKFNFTKCKKVIIKEFNNVEIK